MRGVLSLCTDYQFYWPFSHVPQESEEGSRALCLQHLQVCEICAYEDWKKKKAPTCKH